MDWLGAILEQIHELRCPSCGAKLDEAMIRGVASEEERVLVQIACLSCGESSVAVIDRTGEPAGPPLTFDDVLDAHDLLAAWTRPASELFPVA